MAVNTIVLKTIAGRHEEYTASGICKPGHLIQLDSNLKALVQANYGAYAEKIFAKENALNGKTVTDAYAVGDTVLAHHAVPGDKLQVRLPAACPAVTKGTSLLVPNGDGTFVPSVVGARILNQNVAASTALASFTTIAVFSNGTYTLPANTLRAGDVIRVKLMAHCVSVTSTPTFAVTLKIGSTTVVATGNISMIAADEAVIEANIVIRTVGASGTLIAYGDIEVTATDAATLAGSRGFSLVSTAVDTTASQAITVSGTCSANSASNSIRLDAFEVSIDRPYTFLPMLRAHETVDNSAGVSEAFCSAFVL